jgi:hypothetical protein
MQDVIGAVELLRRVRDLLSDPAKWTQGATARDANGQPTDMNGKSAVCWCLSGALETLDEKRGYADIAAYRLHRRVNEYDFPLDYVAHMAASGNSRWSAERHVIVNDRLGYAAVMKLLDSAIGDRS